MVSTLGEMASAWIQAVSTPALSSPVSVLRHVLGGLCSSEGLSQGSAGPQVLRGCEDAELRNLHLQRNPAMYNFTRQGAGLSVSGGRAPPSGVLGAGAQQDCWRPNVTGTPWEDPGGSAWPRGAEPLVLQALESDERGHYLAVMEAMRVIGFRAEEVGCVHRILAAILHLVSLAGGCGATAPGEGD